MTDDATQAGSQRWARVPAVAWLPQYQRAWLRGDLVAGAVVAALAVPQALGYASIAGAPVQMGLYAVPVALVAYAIFGSSRQLVVGPVSTVSVLSGSFLATFRGRGHGAGRVVHRRARARRRDGPDRGRLPPDRLDGGVPVQAHRHRLRAGPDRPGHPQRAAAPARGADAAGPGRRAGWCAWARASLAAQADLTTVVISAVRARWSSSAASGSRPRLPWGLVVLVGEPGRVDGAGPGGQRRGGRRRRAPRAADPGHPVGGEPGDLAALLGAGAALALVGLAEGLSAATAVRRSRRLPHRRGPGAAGLRRGQRRLRASSVGMGVAGSLSKTAAVGDARGRTQMAGLAAAVLALARHRRHRAGRCPPCLAPC